MPDETRSASEALYAKTLRNSAIVREMRILRELVETARNAQSLEPLFGYLYEAITRDTSVALRDGAACAPGCSWCCYTRVYATIPEILYLAGHDNVRLPQAVVDAIPLRATERVQQSGNGSLTPCAVLGQSLCLAHPRRPIACRTAMSRDAALCRLAFADPENLMIPTDLNSVVLSAAYNIALQGALLHAGYDIDRYDLATGLAETVARPNLHAEWLKGEAKFCSALRIVEEPFLQSPVKRDLYEVAFV